MLNVHRDGDDGLWSTFEIQVGSPGQTVRLLPSTSASAGTTTWVVLDEGCSLANPNLTNCVSSRGGTFARNQSTSWSTKQLDNGGLYELNTYEENFLGLSGHAYYGFDTVSLGSGLPVLNNHQLVAGFATNDFWLGSLGLSANSFNFTSLNDPVPSLLSTLRNQSLIPSTSWAYTAGASYRDPPILGSLTLGGYDNSRFVPNNASFKFGSDLSRDLLVGLQSVSYDTLGSSPLLTRSINVFIDSLVAQIWLPVEACNAFEQAFNLTWDNTEELYLLDEDQHSALLAQNPTFTFSLGYGNNTIDIQLPYAAFDLNATEPFVDSGPQRYFPLKRAENDTQYTLGRVFLQEAYVIADYERHNFTVAQALFPPSTDPRNLVAIHAPGSEMSEEASKDGGGVSKGAIAGIVVAAVVLLVLIIGLVVRFFRRQARTKQRETVSDKTSSSDEKVAHELSAGGPRLLVELEEEEAQVRELEGRDNRKELPAQESLNGKHELAVTHKVHELSSPVVPAAELEAPSLQMHGSKIQ